MIIKNNLIIKKILEYCFSFNIEKDFHWFPILNNKVDKIYTDQVEYNEISKPNDEYYWKINLIFVSKLFFKIIINSFPFQISNHTFYLHFQEELFNNQEKYEIYFKLLNLTSLDNFSSYQVIDKVQKEYFYFENLFFKLGVEKFKQFFKYVEVCQIEFIDEIINIDIEILKSIGVSTSTKFTLLFYLVKNKEDINEKSFEAISNSNLNIESIVIIYPFLDYYEPTFFKWYKIIEYCKSTLKRLYIFDQKHLTHFTYNLSDLLTSIETLFLGSLFQDTYGRPIFNLSANDSFKEVSFQVSDGDGYIVHYSLDWFTENSKSIRHFNYNVLAKDDILEIIVKNIKQLESFSFYIDKLDFNFFNIYSNIKLQSSLSQLSIKIKYQDIQSSDSIQSFTSFLLNNNGILKYLNLIFEDCIDQHFILLKSLFNQVFININCNLQYLSISYKSSLVQKYSLDLINSLFNQLNNNISIKGILFYGSIDTSNFPDLISNFKKDIFSPSKNSIYYIKN